MPVWNALGVLHGNGFTFKEIGSTKGAHNVWAGFVNDVYSLSFTTNQIGVTNQLSDESDLDQNAVIDSIYVSLRPSFYDYRQAYIKYVNKVKEENLFRNAVYKLIDIDGNDVPELYISSQYTAGGDKLCTFVDGQVRDMGLWVSSLSYLEGQNTFMESGGHMDSFYHSIFSIIDGNFVRLHRGDIQQHYGSNSLSQDGTYSVRYTCTWDGQEGLTKEEYDHQLATLFDKEKAVSPFEGTTYDSELDRIVGNGFCGYEEIISALSE